MCRVEPVAQVCSVAAEVHCGCSSSVQSGLKGNRWRSADEFGNGRNRLNYNDSDVQFSVTLNFLDPKELFGHLLVWFLHPGETAHRFL